MANRVYAVTLHVTENNLGTVLSALSGSSTLVSVVPTQKTAAHPNGPSSSSSSADSSALVQHHYTNGKRNKGISGEELALEVLNSSERVFTLGEISNAFVQRGFAGNSSSPVLSKLASAGKVRALGAGKFCKAGLLLKL